MPGGADGASSDRSGSPSSGSSSQHVAPNAGTVHARRGRLLPTLLSVGLIALALYPVVENWREHPDDGFPFSHYPMFSQRIGKSYEVTHAVGVAADGHELAVPYYYVGTGGLNEVLTQLQREAAQDGARLCARVADAVREHPPPALQGVREIAIVTGRYLLEPFYEGRIEAEARTERARCRMAP